MTGLGSKKSSSRISRNTNPLENYRFSDDYNECESKSGIKFTRKFTNQYKPCCCILSCLIISFLSACTFLYCAYLYVKVENGEELSFRGSFTVISNTTYKPGLLNLSAESNESKVALYQRALENAIHVQPGLRLAFMSADILAVDGEEEPNGTVHFEVKFNPRLLFGGDINFITNTLKENLHLPNGIVDIHSVSLKETHSVSMVSASSLSPRVAPPSHILDENFSNILGHCTSITQLPFCSNVESNLTSFPNLFMHKDVADVQNDLIIFRELIDSECFDNAAEFLCQVLQPTCVQRSNFSTETYLPCKQFCDEFVSGCGSRFTERLKQALDCSKFPQYSRIGRNCHKQPNCNVASLKTNDPFTYRMCDGIPDCTDMEDELGCPYCKNGLHCGLTRNCISQADYCNDISDCEDNSDEKNCLSVSSNIIADLQHRTALDTRNPREGFAVHTNEGIPAHVCINKDTINQEILQRTGELFCKSSTYQNLSEVEVKSMDNISNTNYVEIEVSNESKISFISTSNCSSDGLLYIKCFNLECGLQTTRTNSNSIEGLNKLVTNGDWPWYAALFKNGIHSCDATLISESWLLTTVSCFQGQNRAEWIARLGSVRLHSKSPWQQERHIIGMVKSPVEGSTLVLLKLSNPVIYSHFVRPICLPLNHFPAEELTYCNALGWSKTKTLQRVEVKETSLDNCADMSIMMSNGLCAASVYNIEECDEEEMAGSAMLCLTSQQNRWVLIGVSNWRISCTPVEMQRPRLYDKVATNVNWIRSVISEA